MNFELRQMKCSDFRFNLKKVNIHNPCHIIVSPVVCSFQIYSGLMKLDAINKTLKKLICNF